MKRQTIHAQVLQTLEISPNMQRITLQADAFTTFPAECESGYIKLLFTPQGQTDLSDLGQARPMMRTYTVRLFSAHDATISIDMVKHGTEGLASRWAQTANIGDVIEVVGPGLISDIPVPADWFLMAADMTALPALSIKLARLPADATGYAVIKVADKADQQAITAPANVELIWLTEADSLPETVTALPWLAGQASAWVACEFDDMRALRQYLRNDKQLPRERIYLSSYWKHGVTEDGHKLLKHADNKQHGPNLLSRAVDLLRNKFTRSHQG
ncbi:siderophore-interacting protein [Motilimonas pumila]|uniref:Siderophore-interacting protein n=1 Tax=Motilimonas pumila TaxID=2303987 RepID=A0A418YB33_9GAMM|nr:siderophore-interacting protein [Motilimonas pumila]RJG40191.1 siderophore-interacting protein [Motilimonas pumila]